MAELGLERTETASPTGDHLRSILAGAISGSVCFAITVSLAAAVFSGPLQPALTQGLRFILFGGIIFALAGLIFGWRIGAQYQTQSVTGVIAALAVARIAQALPNASLDTLLWTAVGFISLSTALTGLVFLAAGTARLGHLARFIPYPVLGGFLAATGLFLIGRAVLISAPTVDGLISGFDTASLWGPPVVLGAGLVIIERLTGLRYLLLWGIGIVALVAHGGLLLLGLSGIEGMQFLSAAGASTPTLDPLIWSQLGKVNTDAVLSQLPLAFALASLALVAALVNVSAMELEGGRALDLNKEMVHAGGANILSALGGGLAGFHSLSLTKVGRRAGGTIGWIVVITSATVFILAALLGSRFLTLIPVAALSLVLSYVGAELLYRWLWLERRTLSYEENVVVFIILAASALFGFVVALGIGVVAASMLFTISYSRLQVIRSEVSGTLRRSATERSEDDNLVLGEKGGQTAIFELQGFIFFGTANKIVDRVEATVTAPDAPVRSVVLDFRRVQAMDASAVASIRKLHLLAGQWRIDLILTGMQNKVYDMMSWAEEFGDIQMYRTLDKGLSDIEDLILENEPSAGSTRKATDLSRLINDVEASGHSAIFSTRTYEAGATLFAKGAQADSLVMLEEGRLAAIIETAPGKKSRVASFLPGAVVGEVGYYGEIPRTASIVAETSVKVRIIAKEAIEALEHSEPALAARFHALLARQIASRLARTTALIYAIEG